MQRPQVPGRSDRFDADRSLHTCGCMGWVRGLLEAAASDPAPPFRSDSMALRPCITCGVRQALRATVQGAHAQEAVACRPDRRVAPTVERNDQSPAVLLTLRLTVRPHWRSSRSGVPWWVVRPGARRPVPPLQLQEGCEGGEGGP